MLARARDAAGAEPAESDVKIAVTGANGFVGSSVLASLLDNGRDAVGLVRSGRRAVDADGRPLPTRPLDEWDPSALSRALEGIDAVVHSASVVHQPDAPLQAYERFNVTGTEALASACHAAGCRQLVFLSSVKVYGETPPPLVTEDTPVAAEAGYASSKLTAERIVLKARGLSGLVLRLAPVYGKGDKGNVRTMATAIARRRFVLPGGGHNRKSIVHVSTVADSVNAGIDAHLTGTFILADAVAPTMRELADAIARALGRGRPLAVPAPLVEAAADVVGRVAKLVGRPGRINRALIQKSLAPTVFSSAALQKVLGLSCHVDLDAALSEEVDWLRRIGAV